MTRAINSAYKHASNLYTPSQLAPRDFFVFFKRVIFKLTITKVINSCAVCTVYISELWTGHIEV